jgi:hypothetical protein
MKLGTETGSLVNHVMSTSPIKVPKIGDGATILSYTDRKPATVIKVEVKNKVVFVDVQDDDYKRIDNNGMSDSQDYKYTTNTEASISHFRIRNNEIQEIRKNTETGRWLKVGKGGVFFGKREKYHDFSF